MSIKDDVELAKQVIRQEKSTIALHTDNSSVYKSTNEKMNDSHYIELLKSNKSILSVIGSGDQILNSILFDSYDIDAFDINRFAKYYLELKMTAIMTLSYEEYLSFFYDSKTFNKRLYARVLGNMKGDAKEFWDSIAYYRTINLDKNKPSPNEVYNSGLFIPGEIKREDAIEYNPYLSKENYYLLRDKINRARINYHRGNIFELSKSLDKDYDFINLSNICMYTRDILLNDFIPSNDYKRFVSNLRLNPDGKVLSYLMGFTESSVTFRYAERALVNDKHYDIYIVKNKDHVDDAIAVYRKTKKWNE